MYHSQEQVKSDYALYIETTISEIVFDEKNNIKTQKQQNDQNHMCTYNIKILNSFNPELKLTNTKFVIKNKLKHFLNELRDFKFAITLVLK